MKGWREEGRGEPKRKGRLKRIVKKRVAYLDEGRFKGWRGKGKD